MLPLAESNVHTDGHECSCRVLSMTHPRIGFACQYKHFERHLSAAQLKVLEGPFNPRTTTLRWMDSVSPQIAREKLVDIITHNLAAQQRLLAYVSTLPPRCACFRLAGLASILQSPAPAKFLSGLGHSKTTD